MNTANWDDNQMDKLLDDKLNNSSIALSLQQIANSTAQIVGCLVPKPEVQERISNSTKTQRPKPYEIPASRSRTNGSQEQSRPPTGIVLEYSDLLVLNEAVSKLNEVITRLNQSYEAQSTSSSSASTYPAPPQATFHISYPPHQPPTSSSPTTTTTSEDGTHILDYSSLAADISNPIHHQQQQQEEEELDPLLNIANGLSSCLKPCLIVSKDDHYVYEYTIQKKRFGNEYYCCSSCRKLPSPRSNLVIYVDGKITCSSHNHECIPILKEESISKQQKRQIRLSKKDIVIVEEEEEQK